MAKRIVYYKCPFSCNNKYEREKLVRHVDNKHQDELPEGFSALRYVFHYVNNKPLEYHGRCTECKGPTPWDENVGRYKRQCGKQECHDSFVRKFEENMVKKTGHKRVTETQKGLEEMLKKRKISGKYTFQNGKQKEYVGTYEKKCLEFMDKVMNIDPDDILAPGPTLEYILDGKKHYYITDFYYQPYDLIIEVKDGGDNPNKRNMPEYRKKQMAKEKFIIDNTDYNYIRLTNNDMSQLLAVMADLKMQLVDGSNDRVIHVNEAGYRTDPYEITVRNYIHESSTFRITKLEKITDKSIKNIDNKYTKHLRITDNTEGYLIYSFKKFIGLFNLENKEEGKWIQALEVVEEFRNMGYGKYILKEAEQHGAKYLSVNKKNLVAFNMYKKNGWKVYDETETMYFMNKDTKIIESTNIFNEKVLFNEPDILYNKDKFDNGKINICFVTGLSGSGKSTLANDMEKDGVEKYELDDVLANYAFSDKNLKEYGDLIYSFFMGKGKQYRMTEEPSEENNWLNNKYTDEFEKGLIRDFVLYSINYAKSHSNKKFVIEGVELYWFFKPEELKDYAVYIKGTSAVISMIRSASRDSKDVKGLKRISSFLKNLLRKDRTHAYLNTEKIIKQWREYYNGLTEKKTVNESRTVKSKFKAYDINDNEAKKYIMNDNYISKYADYLKENTGEIIIDPIAKKIVGYVFIGDKKDKGFISTLDVKPEYRQQGFGTILIQDAVKLYGAIDLVVLKSNQIAIDLYTKNGFEVYKEIIHENQPAYWMKVKKQVVSEASTSEFNKDLENNIIMNADKLKKEEKIVTDAKGIINYIVKIRKYDEWLRGRSELLLFKNDSILLVLDPDGKGYTLPGGGWEKDEDHARSAQRECEEEVGYETTPPKYSLTYAAKFPPKEWVKKKISKKYWWYGEYIELYCADYNGIYNEIINPVDADPYMKRNAKWYSINVVWNLLIPPHQIAIKKYLNKNNNPFSPTFIP